MSILNRNTGQRLGIYSFVSELIFSGCVCVFDRIFNNYAPRIFFFFLLHLKSRVLHTFDFEALLSKYLLSPAISSQVILKSLWDIPLLCHQSHQHFRASHVNGPSCLHYRKGAVWLIISGCLPKSISLSPNGNKQGGTLGRTGGPQITAQNIPHHQVCTRSFTCGQDWGVVGGGSRTLQRPI